MPKLGRKLSRKERRKLRRERKETEPSESQLERAFYQILLQERTPELNSEGYHFIRPEWHHYVYGGGKKGEK